MISASKKKAVEKRIKERNKILNAKAKECGITRPLTISERWEIDGQIAYEITRRDEKNSSKESKKYTSQSSKNRYLRARKLSISRNEANVIKETKHGNNKK